MARTVRGESGREPPEDARARLKEIADRFNGLLARLPGATVRARAAISRYLEMAAEHRERWRRNRAARRAKVKTVLAAGFLNERSSEDGEGLDWEEVRGPFPTEAVALWEGKACPMITAPMSLGGRRKSRASPLHLPVGAACPLDLEQQLAAAALAVLDAQDRRADVTSKDENQAMHAAFWAPVHRGTHCEAHFHVGFRPPAGTEDDGCHPAHLEWDALLTLPRRDLLAVACARLVGLRDVHSLSPLIEWPLGKKRLKGFDAATLETFWHWSDHDDLRPVARDLHDGALPVLDPAKLSPDLAEKFLEVLEPEWAARPRPEEVLRRLADRESWRLDELPVGIGPDELRLLDVDGAIELRCWVRQNLTTDPARPHWKDQPWTFGWFSPSVKPDMAGSWDRIFRDVARPGRPAPEVRVSEKGRAELTRQQLQDSSPGPKAASQPSEKTPAKPNELSAGANGNQTPPDAVPPLAASVPPITQDHLTVLRALTKPKPGVVYTVVEMAGRGPIKNRETLGRMLRELLGYRMVAQPHGPRAGYCIDTLGLQCLDWDWAD